MRHDGPLAVLIHVLLAGNGRIVVNHFKCDADHIQQLFLADGEILFHFRTFPQLSHLVLIQIPDIVAVEIKDGLQNSSFVTHDYFLIPFCVQR